MILRPDETTDRESTMGECRSLPPTLFFAAPCASAALPSRASTRTSPTGSCNLEIRVGGRVLRRPRTTPTGSLFDVETLGERVTVFLDEERNGPWTIMDERQGLRRLEGDAYENAENALIDDIQIVSIYTLHVALYALQNPTPEIIKKALYLIGTSGDCEEHWDDETMMPLPVPPPHGWSS